VGTITQLLDALSPDPRERGRQFEHLCRWYLLNDPTYSLIVQSVWLWDEWPGRWARDAGIDLVAETRTGELWAVQAKCFNPDYALKKADIDSFLSESSREVFSFRLLIATTDRLGPTAQRTLAEQEKPAHCVLLAALESTGPGWPESPNDLALRRQPRKAPYPHNERAVEQILNGFKKTARGQAIMACGTGKTLVALWSSERLEACRTLVLVPSLSLLAQTLREWSANASRQFEFLPVCSDETVSDEDHFISQTIDLGFPVTTDPEQIADFLRRPGPSVVFSTYQSSPMVAEAFKQGAPALDLVVADEAHRCAGAPSEAFRTVLVEDLIRTKRRLFMTATPRYLSAALKKKNEGDEFKLTSMDDERAFGPVFHRLTFGEAIAQGLLSDYQVAIVGVDEPTYAKFVADGLLVALEGRSIDARSLASQIALTKAVAKFDLQRILTFHSRVRVAKRFTETLHDTIAAMPPDERPADPVWASYVSGEMPSGERDRRLRIFGDATVGARRLLANVRCLSEGVDVPSIDGLAFIDPRGSPVDIVQAVGRVLRRSAGKTKGTVVLPVFIDSASGADLTLSNSVFAPVWQVLVALRAHDETLAEELDELRRSIGRGSAGWSRLPSKVILDLPTTVGEDFVRAFTVLLVEKTTRGWEFWYGLLEEYVRETGDATVPAKLLYRTFPLGTWVNLQRVIYAHGVREADGTIRLNPRGVLSPDRVRRLEGLFGWSWDVFGTRFELGLRCFARYVAEGGNSNPPRDAKVTQAGSRAPFLIGKWVGELRAAYRQGRLAQSRIELLEAIPGWTWAPYADSWERAFEHLVQYVVRTGHSNVPDDHCEDDFRLGRWVSQQKAFPKRLGRLSEDRRARLESLPGWSWGRSYALSAAGAARHTKAWQTGFDRLARFADENDHARVPRNYRDEDFNLGEWVSVQRKNWTKGLLSVEREKLLEAIPGWTWAAHGDAWEKGFASLEAYLKCNDGAKMPVPGEVDAYGVNLGGWIRAQRKLYQRGTIDPTRRERLESLPGWLWAQRGSEAPSPTESPGRSVRPT
jgi:superfamily II DNA or RNA helicase